MPAGQPLWRAMESIFLGTDQVSRASIHTERLISEVVVRRHSTRLPWSQKWRRFDCIANTERSLQPTTSAISVGGQLLRIMSRICICFDSARIGIIIFIFIRFIIYYFKKKIII